jgi:hypothetical protein
MKKSLLLLTIGFLVSIVLIGIGINFHKAVYHHFHNVVFHCAFPGAPVYIPSRDCTGFQLRIMLLQYSGIFLTTGLALLILTSLGFLFIYRKEIFRKKLWLKILDAITI